MSDHTKTNKNWYGANCQCIRLLVQAHIVIALLNKALKLLKLILAIFEI